MTQALEIGTRISPSQLAFSQKTLKKIGDFSVEFEHAITNYKSSLDYQVLRNKDYGEIVRKARLYISHFVQVLNLAIAREEMDPRVREYYGLGIDDSAVPSLIQESEIANWGNAIIEGEQKRIGKGGNPLYSPSIALVKVHYSNFKDAYHLQKTLQANTIRALDKIGELRETADNLIRDLWNEIELHYQFLSPKHKRQKAKEYGVVYIYRRNELKKASPEELQTDLVFEM